MAVNQRSPNAYTNTLLAHLAPQRIEHFGRHLHPIEFEVRQNIYRPNEPMRHAYFVETGMISIVSIMEDGRNIEVGTIGSEGMAGSALLLGAESVPYHYYVQILGHGHRVDAAILKDEADQSECFRELILRYQTAILTQAMQTAACNGLHSVLQRCCRWLLMSRDRVRTDTVAITHEFLAIMLGVRRASVTDVLGPLQERGWIQSNRGDITILDRQGLESGSCECYRVITAQHDQLRAPSF
jgi:CRP-like cAMP-binding protein